MNTLKTLIQHKARWAAILLILFTTVLVVNQASIVQAQTGTGFSLTPTVTDIDLGAGDSESFTVTVKNITSDTITVEPSYIDFKPGVTGEPILLFDGEKSDYSIKNFISQVSEQSIAANSSSSFQFMLQIPESTIDGSYYGAVVFRNTAQNSDGAQLQSSLASLVLVDVGSPRYDASVLDLITPLSSTPGGEMKVSVKNDGDFKFVPNVIFEITDQLGDVVNTVDANENGNVLPSSTRNFTGTIPAGLDPLVQYTVRASAEYADGEAIPRGESTETTINLPATTPVIEESAIDNTTEESVDKSIAIQIAIGLVGVAIVICITLVVLKINKKGVKSTSQSTPMQSSLNTDAYSQTSQTNDPQIVVPTTKQPPEEPPENPRL